MSAQAQRLRQREDLEGRVENALMGIEPVRSSDVPLRLDVDAGGGIKLKGWVRSRVIKDMIEDVVLRVPGVASLVLELVVDPELEVGERSSAGRCRRDSSDRPGADSLRQAGRGRGGGPSRWSPAHRKRPASRLRRGGIGRLRLPPPPLGPIIKKPGQGAHPSLIISPSNPISGTRLVGGKSA
jgi:hypothetical protein